MEYVFLDYGRFCDEGIYFVRKVKGGYRVSTPRGVKSKRTSKRRAEAQERLFNAVERGWRLTRGKKSKKRGRHKK